MFNKILHLIEPTLTGLSGHEYGYVASLISANKSFAFDIHVWLGKKASNKDIVKKLLHINKHSVKIHKYFIRSVRQIQKCFLYYKLLKNNQIIYICTSGLIDLIICDLLIKLFFKHDLINKLVFFHFHQFSKNINKINKLKNISINIKNNFHILTTTDNLSNIFREQGFKKVNTIACPSFTPKKLIEKLQYDFNKILYAGVARADKGFSLIVETIRDMQAQHAYLPFVLQVSPPISKRYDPQTALAVTKLQQISNNNYKIRLYKHALNDQQYQDLFVGAICLLVYDKEQYADKFSGVTLDAFYAGCPVITVSDTWMGDITSHFTSGIVLQYPTVINISAAILQIKERYLYYHNNAKKAGAYLLKIHDPKHSLQVIYDYL